MDYGDTVNIDKAKQPIIARDISEDILGKWVKDLQLHTLFASLETEEQIVKWVNHFGLPYYEMPKKDPWFPKEEEVVITDLFALDELIPDDNYSIGNPQLSLDFFLPLIKKKDPIKEEIEFWNEEAKPIKLSAILKEAKEFKMIIDLHRAITQKNFQEIEDILVADGYYYLKDFKNRDHTNYAKKRIHDSLHKGLREVSPYFGYPVSNWEWQFPTLLSAMYLMIYLDFKVGNLPVKCKRRKCCIYFVPGRENKVYCTKECQEKDKSYRYQEEGKRIDSIRDKEGRTPLMRAIMQQDLNKFYDLITKGINLNIRDKKGMTALHYAAIYGTNDMVEEVIQKRTSKISIKKKDNHGKTAMDLAAELNKNDVCKILEKEGETRKKLIKYKK